MLSIQSTNSNKCTPNLLPARLNHNGPINNTQRYWSPTTDEKGTPAAVPAQLERSWNYEHSIMPSS